MEKENKYSFQEDADLNELLYTLPDYQVILGTSLENFLLSNVIEPDGYRYYTNLNIEEALDAFNDFYQNGKEDSLIKAISILNEEFDVLIKKGCYEDCYYILYLLSQCLMEAGLRPNLAKSYLLASYPTCSEVQFTVAKCLYKGKLFERNRNLSLRLFLKLAEKGNDNALYFIKYNIGIDYNTLLEFERRLYKIIKKLDSFRRNFILNNNNEPQDEYIAPCNDLNYMINFVAIIETEEYKELIKKLSISDNLKKRTTLKLADIKKIPDCSEKEDAIKRSYSAIKTAAHNKSIDFRKSYSSPEIYMDNCLKYNGRQ